VVRGVPERRLAPLLSTSRRVLSNLGTADSLGHIGPARRRARVRVRCSPPSTTTPRQASPTLLGRASITVSSGDAQADDSLGVRLLEDIRRTFNERGSDRITTADLVADLVSDAESPWVELHKGKPITAAGLARLLKPFGISSRTIWLGEEPDGEPRGSAAREKTKKGYHRERFEDAWGRYLPSETSGRQDPSGHVQKSDFVPSADAGPDVSETAVSTNNDGPPDGLTAGALDNGHTGVSDTDPAGELTLLAAHEDRPVGPLVPEDSREPEMAKFEL